MLTAVYPTRVMWPPACLAAATVAAKAGSVRAANDPRDCASQLACTKVPMPMPGSDTDIALSADELKLFHYLGNLGDTFLSAAVDGDMDNVELDGDLVQAFTQTPVSTPPLNPSNMFTFSPHPVKRTRLACPRPNHPSPTASSEDNTTLHVAEEECSSWEQCSAPSEPAGPSLPQLHPPPGPPARNDFTTAGLANLSQLATRQRQQAMQLISLADLLDPQPANSMNLADVVVALQQQETAGQPPQKLTLSLADVVAALQQQERASQSPVNSMNLAGVVAALQQQERASQSPVNSMNLAGVVAALQQQKRRPQSARAVPDRPPLDCALNSQTPLDQLEGSGEVSESNLRAQPERRSTLGDLTEDLVTFTDEYAEQCKQAITSVLGKRIEPEQSSLEALERQIPALRPDPMEEVVFQIFQYANRRQAFRTGIRANQSVQKRRETLESDVGTMSNDNTMLSTCLNELSRRVMAVRNQNNAIRETLSSTAINNTIIEDMEFIQQLGSLQNTPRIDNILTGKSGDIQGSMASQLFTSMCDMMGTA